MWGVSESKEPIKGEFAKKLIAAAQKILKLKKKARICTLKIKIEKYIIILLEKMTFKKFISALFEKWTCKHEWERWQIVHVTDDIGGSYHIDHFKCKKCGKFKKVKSY